MHMVDKTNWQDLRSLGNRVDSSIRKPSDEVGLCGHLYMGYINWLGNDCWWVDNIYPHIARVCPAAHTKVSRRLVYTIYPHYPTMPKYSEVNPNYDNIE